MSAAPVPQQEMCYLRTAQGQRSLCPHLGQRSSQGMLSQREGSWGDGGKGREGGRGEGRTIVIYLDLQTQNFQFVYPVLCGGSTDSQKKCLGKRGSHVLQPFKE